ncbi:autotransporter outer membrane beta-barrel domain-containing protein [Aureimonas fodinaquatilis]|uniref:autotransporter family protein n=1 Tax=Aureimonas fodinaquatilis TaxID=2565783 RepID=UPI00165E0478|nr:autotransporter outer membrane beta-barrel domain-containing protein [Aureimonas fodinaquatilis]
MAYIFKCFSGVPHTEKTSVHTRISSLLLTGSVLAILTGPAAAQVAWVGPDGGSWFDPLNWSPAAVPTGTDDVIISSGSATITSAPAATANSVAISGSGGLLVSDANVGTLGSINLTGAGPSTIPGIPGTFVVLDGASSTGGAEFNIFGSGTSPFLDGGMFFDGTSDASTSVLRAQNGSQILFLGSSSASSATVVNGAGGMIGFLATSTTGSAAIFNNDLALLRFAGSSTAAGSAIVNEIDGQLDISEQTGSLAVGALSGGGNVYLGASNLTVGGLDTSTTISGSIADGISPLLDSFNVFTGTTSPVLVGGSLTKTGTGTLTLSGSNTYTGGTLIESGTVQISADDNLGAASSALTFNGGVLQTTADLSMSRAISILASGATIDVASGTAFTQAGLVAGSGDLAKIGLGELVLTGSNSQTGTIFVTDGTLRVGDGGTSGELAGNVDVTTQLIFNRADSASYGGTLTGSGVIVQQGPGRLDLTSSNSFSGDIYAANGTLGINNGAIVSAGNVYIGASPDSSPASGTLVLANGGRLLSATPVIIAPDAGSSGTLAIGAPAGSAAEVPGYISAPVLSFGDGDATVAFNHTDQFYVFDAGLPGGLTGSGTIETYSGRSFLLQDSSAFTGVSALYGGTLAVNGALGGTIDVLPGGRLEGLGFVGTTANAGTVAPGNSIGTLTILGDYIGNGGILETEVVLGDDSSPTDLLIVSGSTSGSTSVRVINLGGTGGQTVEGIRIVQVDGASTGTFSLLADYVTPDGQLAVVGGAYAYSLYQGAPSTPDDGDWYLRSLFLSGEGTPAYQPGAPLYEAYPQTMAALNRLPTLQQRVGSRLWSGNVSSRAFDKNLIGETRTADMIEKTGAWGRIEGSTGSFEPAVSTTGSRFDTDYARLQVGFDGLVHERENGSGLVAGASAHFGRANSEIWSIYGDGKIDTDGYGFGATLTWYDQSGFYVDGQAQVTWFDSNITSTTLGVVEASNNNGMGYAISVEAGQALPINESWTITPQAQLIYSSVDFDDFEDAFGVTVRRLDGDNLQGRLGVSADQQQAWQGANGQLQILNLYGIANIYYDFTGETRIAVADVELASRQERLWGGLGFGGDYNWGDGYSLYGELSARTTLESFADSYVLDGNIGFRVKF